MPNRILRESILDSEAVNKLSPEAEVFYRRLMSVVDDFGLFDARPAVLRSRLYPLQLDRVREVNVARWLKQCESASLIRLYSANGGQYLSFLKLGEPRAISSKYPKPPPEESCAQTRADADTSAHARPYSSSLSDAPTDSSSEKTNPPTPQGGKHRGKADVPLPDIPPELDTPQFREAWGQWLEDRTERRKKVTPRSASAAFAKMVPFGPVVAAEAIRDSIAGGWSGLFPESVAKRQPGGGKDRGAGFRTHSERCDNENLPCNAGIQDSPALPPRGVSGS